MKRRLSIDVLVCYLPGKVRMMADSLKFGLQASSESETLPGAFSKYYFMNLLKYGIQQFASYDAQKTEKYYSKKAKCHQPPS